MSVIPESVLALMPRKYKECLSSEKRLKINVVRDDDKGITKYHIVSHNDGILINLAKKIKFPRGFTIVVHDSGNRVDAVGFYPKFDNDKSSSDVTSSDVAEIKRGGSATVTLKFSGHLLKILALKNSDGTLEISLETKNTSTHEFVKNGLGVVNKFMTPKLLEYMYDNGIALLGEMMASYDSVHGAFPLQDAFVLTCVSQSNLGNESPEVVKHYDHTELLELAIRFGIPVAPFWKVEGDHIDALLNGLNEERDLCHYTDVIKILGPPAFVGSIDHASILGRRLEGLVIFGTDKTVKFKFGRYTSVTFGLRAIIRNGGFDDPGSFNESVEQYIKQWIRTDKGRDYFRSWFSAARFEFMARRDAYDDPSGHIRLADYVTDNLEECLNKSTESPTALATDLGLIVLVGPIGFGKSTYGAEFSRMLKIPHIDGDGHGLSKLGKERNDATKGLILSALKQTGAAVVSTGGGAIQGIIGSICAAFPGAKLQVATFVVCSVDQSETFDEKSHSLVDLYNIDKVTTASILSERKERLPEWSDAPLEKIHAASRGNVKFAQQCVRGSDFVGLLPRVLNGQMSSSCLSGVLLPMIPVCPPPRMTARQARAAVRVSVPTRHNDVPVAGHFTLKYSTTPFESSEVEPLNIETINAKLYVFKSNQDSVSVVIPDEHPCIPEHLHVTVDPGKHKPGLMKEVTLNVRDSRFRFSLDQTEYTEYTVTPAEIEVVIPLFFVP